MAQRQIIINAYPLIECGPDSFTVTFDFGEKTPSKRFAIETVADCKAALQSLRRRTRTNAETLAPDAHASTRDPAASRTDSTRPSTPASSNATSTRISRRSERPPDPAP